MIHPPKFGATVASFDASKAKDVKGFVQAVQISRGVAVVAETMWAALKARDLVSVTWNEEKAEQRSTADILSAYEAQSKQLRWLWRAMTAMLLRPWHRPTRSWRPASPFPISHMQPSNR